MAKKTGAPRIDFDELDQQPTTGILMAPVGMLGQEQPAPAGSRVVQQVPVELIDPNPYQARKRFDPATINELAQSMRAQGFTTVLWVRKHPTHCGRYQLVYGERRLRAATLIASDQEPRFRVVPCEVVDMPDERMKEIGLLENIQREDLLPEEEARSFRDLLDMTLAGGERAYSIRRLAAQLGKDESYIQDRLFLLEMPADVKGLYEQFPEIALRALREVCNLPTATARKPVLDRIRLERMSFARVRQLVQAVLEDLEVTNRNGYDAGQRGGEDQRALQKKEKRQAEAEIEQPESPAASITPSPAPGTNRDASAPLAVYTGLLRRDTKVIFPILDGWEKLLTEEDEAVRQLLAGTLEQVLARCMQLQASLQERVQD
jgi:ParB family transcriptional regulator, chromosome partitioning protein